MIKEWDLAENVSHSDVCMELMTCCITGFHTFSATLVVVTLKFGTWSAIPVYKFQLFDTKLQQDNCQQLLII